LQSACGTVQTVTVAESPPMLGRTRHWQAARQPKAFTCTAFALFLVSLQCCAMSDTSSGVGSLQQSRQGCRSPGYQPPEAARCLQQTLMLRLHSRWNGMRTLEVVRRSVVPPAAAAPATAAAAGPCAPADSGAPPPLLAALLLAPAAAVAPAAAAALPGPAASAAAGVAAGDSAAGPPPGGGARRCRGTGGWGR
jgi:hypothetical protein